MSHPDYLYDDYNDFHEDEFDDFDMDRDSNYDDYIIKYMSINSNDEEGCEDDRDYDDMDGDFDSAMRDAGFGTDEDYGYYGDDTPMSDDYYGGE